MGICSSKHRFFGKNKESHVLVKYNSNDKAVDKSRKKKNQNMGGNKSPFFAFYTRSPTNYLFSKGSNGSPNMTPKRLFRRAFAPLSPAQHMKAVLARRHMGNGEERLNKSFGFLKHIGHKYEIGEEVGKGHFGHTCKSRCKKGEHKGQPVAVKIISKSKVSFIIFLFKHVLNQTL